MLSSPAAGTAGLSTERACDDRMPRPGCERVPMSRHLTPDQAREATRTRTQLLEQGWGERSIARAIEDKRLRRLQRNRYVLESLWQELWPESRHLLEAVAVRDEMRDSAAALSYESAAVAFGLPLYRHVPRRVHLTVPSPTRSSSRGGLIRHRESLAEEDVVVCDGLRCTSLDRTVFDVIRVVGRETAVAVADAALRRVAVSGRAYDVDRAEQWREDMLRRVAQAQGARGIRQAEAVLRFTDGRAELPGESVLRFQLSRLGFTCFGLQVPVAGPLGSDYFVDLEVEEAQTFVEFDGKGKYLDEALRSGRTIEQVLLAEKQREDWIRGTTQRRFIRVEDAHTTTTDALAKRLASFGISPPRG